MKFHTTQRGSVALAAAVLPLLLIVIAFVLFSSTAPSSASQVRAFINHLALTGIKEYSYFECSDPTNFGGCHTEKMDEATYAVRALSARNTRLIGNTQIVLTDSGTDLYLEPLKYFHSEKGAEAKSKTCLTYPCLIAVGNDELATAIRVTGVITSAESSVLDWAGSLFGINQDLSLQVAAAAHITPIDFVVLIDRSPSTAEYTHLSSKQAPPAPVAGVDPQTAFFALELPSGVAAGATESELAFDALPDTRPAVDPPTDPRVHFKSDYTNEFAALGPGPDHWSAYGDNKKYHPEPVSTSDSSPNIYEGASNIDPIMYFVDGHRSPSYSGPEPFDSILRATATIIDKLEQRQVPQDYFSVIFYSHYLPWSSVISMNSNLNYVKTLLTKAGNEPGVIPILDSFGGMIPLDPRSTAGGPTDYSNKMTLGVPNLYNLRLFPTDVGYTDEMLAYNEALYQFNSIPGDRISSKAIIEVTDALNTCVRGDVAQTFVDCPSTGDPSTFDPACAYRPIGPTQACRASYDIYAAGDAVLDAWVAENLFKAGITLNIAQFGTSSGPHHLLLQGDKTGGRCLTDAEARAKDIDWVAGQNIQELEEGRGLYNNRYNSPFFQAAHDAYMRTVLTGGLYAPLLATAGDCASVPTSCSASDPNTGTKVFESCDSTEVQLVKHFDKILEDTTKFSLVDPSI